MVKVILLECNSYDFELIYNLIKKGLKLIGFNITPTTKVLLKPNVLSQQKPEKAITTHPAIVEAVCKIFKELKAEILIGDSSGISSYGATKKAFKVSGIEAVAKKYGAKLIPFEADNFVNIENENYRVLKSFRIAKTVKEVDYIINLPKLKTHTLMKYTGAVKNMFGSVPGGLKSRMHSVAVSEEEFAHLLLDIYQNIKPQLNIMDAVVGLEGNGPGSGGTPKKTGLIMMSENAVALDIIASEIIGYKWYEVKTNLFAIKRNIFDDKIEVIGKKRCVNYKKPAVNKLPGFIVKIGMKFMLIRPYINKDKCKKCAICVEVCPVKAIRFLDYPVIERTRCITCYCCHEHCPHNAIELKRSLIGKAIKGVKHFIEHLTFIR